MQQSQCHALLCSGCGWLVFSLLFHFATGLSVLVDFCFIQFVLFSYFQSHWFLLFFLLFSFLVFPSRSSVLLFLVSLRWECRVLIWDLLFWCEHFNAINMFSFFFLLFLMYYVFVFIYFSVFLKFCSFAHDLFKSILLNVEVLGCFMLHFCYWFVVWFHCDWRT